MFAHTHAATLSFLLIFAAQSAGCFDGTSLPDEASPSCGSQPQALVNTEGLTSHNCGRDNVFIVARNERDGQLACAGVTRAISFFKQWNLQSEKPIEIIIAEDISPLRVEQGFSWEIVYGFLDPRDLRVYMGPYALVNKNSGLMSLPFSEEFYISYVAHEVTHILAQHFYGHACKLMPKEQQEYIAYFSQISTLNPELRKEIIDAFAEKRWEPFAGIHDIHPGYHDMNPAGFAVKSYIYGSTPEGQKVFRDYLAGTVPPRLDQ